MKNKGFTLVELMVAMAIGTVVLLMVSVMLVRGTSLFREENDEVNMRNDYQVIRNQVDQAIMEAKSLVVERRSTTDGDILIIYTGDINTNRSFASAERTTEKVIIYVEYKNTLYICPEYNFGSNFPNEIPEGNMISTDVEKFDISIDESCIREEVVEGVTTEYYVDPLRVKIELKLEKTRNDGKKDFTINLRNRIKEVVDYTTSSSALLTDPSVTKETHQVK